MNTNEYEKNIQYLQKKFWYDYLGSLFEEVSPTNWKENSRFFGMMASLAPHYCWYKNGPFAIGIKTEENRQPTFKFAYLEPDGNTIVTDKQFTFNRAEEFKCVIQAFSNPQELYICMGIDWIAPILEKALSDVTA